MPLISTTIRLFFIIFLFIQFHDVNGQEQDLIRGELFNSQDKKPISFATVLVKNKAKGAVSNTDGSFIIPYKYKLLGDTLVISLIGYATKEIPLSTLERNQVNLIPLDEKVDNLSEVVVMASEDKKRRRKKDRTSPSDIVTLALKKIPKNYPFKPFSYVGYYRDYQKKEGKYVNLNEALLQVFDTGFGNKDLEETQTRIYKYERNPNFPFDTLASQFYDYANKSKIVSDFKLGIPGQNEFILLRLHDAIRNYNVNSYDFVNRLDVNIIDNHELRLLSDTYLNNISLYTVSLYKRLKNFRVYGKLYISKGDYKIYKMQYAVYDVSKPSIEENSSDNPSLTDDNPEKLVFEIIVEYQRQDGRMYPNYISFNNSFEVLQKPKFYIEDAVVHFSKGLFSQNSIVVAFNNFPVFKDATKISNYEIEYKGEVINIEKIEMKKYRVFLYLDTEDSSNLNQMISSNDFAAKDLIIKAENIKDIDGNIINEGEYESHNQYREFFVQELKLQETKPLDTLFMYKDRPIFKEQNLAPFEKLEDYWMNTPLKN